MKLDPADPMWKPNRARRCMERPPLDDQERYGGGGDAPVDAITRAMTREEVQRFCCTNPPSGWHCTRDRHHTGPCAPIPLNDPSLPYPIQIAELKCSCPRRGPGQAFRCANIQHISSAVWCGCSCHDRKAN